MFNFYDAMNAGGLAGEPDQDRPEECREWLEGEECADPEEEDEDAPTNRLAGGESDFRYLDPVRRPLFSREQEFECAKRLEEGKARVARVLDRYGPRLLEGPSKLRRASKGTTRDGEKPPEDLLERQAVRDLNQKLKDLVRRLTELEKEIRASQKAMGRCLGEACRLPTEAGRSRSSTVHTVRKAALSIQKRATLKKRSAQARKEIRSIESMTDATAEELREDLSRLEEGLAMAHAARREFVEANLRLVYTVARKLSGKGVPLADLIQEGNLGLIRAVDGFDHRMRCRFSTYAMWWIRQAVVRAVQNQAHTIRTPIHMHELSRKVKQSVRDLTLVLGREPSAEEIAERSGLPLQKVTAYLENQPGGVTTSLDASVGDMETPLYDFIRDESADSPEEISARRAQVDRIATVLSTLSPREEAVLRKRFGLGGDDICSLAELGRQFGLSRERIRQIEAKALKKLSHASRKKMMRSLVG